MDTTERYKQQDLFEVTNLGFRLRQNHILTKIKNAYNFDRWEKILKNRYSSNRGRKPRDIVMKAKMMLLGYLYNLSDKKVEDQLNENLMFRWFCDLPIFEDSPDHTSLCRFRKAVGEVKLRSMFNDIVAEARSKQVVKDEWHVGDATHLLANVSASRKSVSNKKYMISREQNAPKRWRKHAPKRPSDIEARWGAKSKHFIFYGYKLHGTIDLDSKLFTNLHITSGEAHDGVNLIQILDLRAKNYTADKIYDTQVNRFLLRDNKIRNWIYRKGKITSAWLRKKRSSIERLFGEAKLWHGFEKSRYRGLKKVMHHCYWTVMALNLKKLAVLTT